MSGERTLDLLSVFHLNLCFSSIEESARADVIRACYRPLLALVHDHDIPLGIEASGSTLETIAEIEPQWVEKLGELVDQGRCEFVGSGYAQIIGPLVPAAVNRRNQRLGRETYRRLLGRSPDIALVNEQAFSSGIVEHYLDAGYRGIMMEWDNAARHHPEWDGEWKYYPQVACSQVGGRIPLIWSHSIAFQKFQRYAQGEMTLEDYLSYVASHVGEGPRLFPLYGNDAEIFDYRPGRFDNEPILGLEEWSMIENLYGELRARSEYRLVLPSQALDRDRGAPAGNALNLESAAAPIPVKKQGKYNVTRWALTGRNDLAINSECYEVFHALEAKGELNEADWKNLICLWSSDLRTHITPDRWQLARTRMNALRRRAGLNSEPHGTPAARLTTLERTPPPDEPFRIRQVLHTVEVGTPALQLELNVRRGLAIKRFQPLGRQAPWLFGTLPHGYYDDIYWGADFYSGHLVFEGAGQPKVTDLSLTIPRFAFIPETGQLEVACTVDTPLGPVEKRILVEPDQPKIHIDYQLQWDDRSVGCLRLGHVTLNPEAFDRETLHYRTHNGGDSLEKFSLAGGEVDHGAAVSFLVSSSHALGITEGVIDVGDRAHRVSVRVDQGLSSVLPLVTLRHVGGSYFCRVSFSAQEMDDTTRGSGSGPLGRDSRVFLTLSAT